MPTMEKFFSDMQKRAAGQSGSSNPKQPADDPQAADDFPDNPS